MLFLKPTSINELFNKKNRLNPNLQSFETLSEGKKGKDKNTYDKTENSAREEKKGLKEEVYRLSSQRKKETTAKERTSFP